MASRSSNRAAVPEAKGALVQRRPYFQAERISRRIYGQENDRAAGKTDGRQITSAFSSNRRKASGIDLDAFFC